MDGWAPGGGMATIASEVIKYALVSDTMTFTADTTSGSKTLTGIDPTTLNFAYLGYGSEISNPAIPAGTFIESVNEAAGTALMNLAATETSSGAVITISPQLGQCTRGAYGTTASIHAAGAVVYPPSVTTLTSGIGSDPISSLAVVNTAGLPRIGALLIDQEWFTYDNLHLPAGADPVHNLYNIARGCFGSALASHAGSVEVVMSSPADVLVAGGMAGGGLEQTISSFGVAVNNCQFYYDAHPLRHNVRVQGTAYDVQLSDSYMSAPGYAMAVDAQPEQQQIAYSGSQDFYLGFHGQPTTLLPHNATAAEIQSALRALPGIGTDITCTGTSLGPPPGEGAVLVTFSGQHYGPQPLLTVVPTTAGVNISEVTAGYGGGCRAKHNRYTNSITHGKLLDPGLTPLISAEARGCLLYLQANQPVPSGSSPQFVKWDLASYDTDLFWGGSIPGATSDQIIIPANAGINKIRLSAQVQWVESADSGDRGLLITNESGPAISAGLAQDTRSADPDNVTTQSASTAIIPVQAGDVLHLGTWQTSAGGASLDLTAGSFTWIQLEVMEGA